METGWGSGYRRATVSFTQAVITMPCTPWIGVEEAQGGSERSGFSGCKNGRPLGAGAMGILAPSAHLALSGSVLGVGSRDEGPVLIGDQGNAGVQGLHA